jgi:hypothetical protein
MIVKSGDTPPPTIDVAVGVGVGVTVATVSEGVAVLTDGADTTNTPCELLVTSISSVVDADRPSTGSVAVNVA